MNLPGISGLVLIQFHKQLKLLCIFPQITNLQYVKYVNKNHWHAQILQHVKHWTFFNQIRKKQKQKASPDIEAGLYQNQHGQIYMIFLQFLAPTKQNIKIGTSANQCLNTCPLIVQTNKTKYTFLVRIPESEWTSARKECNCKEASLCLDSSVWIAPISVGRDDTRALNFEITWFRPESCRKKSLFPASNRDQKEKYFKHVV